MKIKSKNRASLIRLTLFDLNKKGLVFAGFLLVGLVFVVVLSWFTIRETGHEPQTSFNSEGPSLPLATPTGLKTTNVPISNRELEIEMSKKIYKMYERRFTRQFKKGERPLLLSAGIQEKENTSTNKKISPEEFKKEMESKEYTNLYLKEIKEYDERQQDILRDYKRYKISTFPKLGKDRLPKKEKSGFMSSLNTWWDGIYGDVEKRDREKERRRLRSIGQ